MHGLRVDLRDAALGDSEGCRDFRESHFFKIVHRQHLPLHVRELLEPGHDDLREILFLQLAARAGLRFIGDDVVQRNAVGVLVVSLAIERHEARGFDFIEQRLVFFGGEREFGADFLLPRRASEFLFERRDAVAEMLRLVAKRARHPVHPAQLVVHRSANVKGGESCERRVSRRVEFLRGGHQSRDADAVEILQIERGGEVDAHAIHRGFCQREMLLHECVFIACGVVGARGDAGGNRW